MKALLVSARVRSTSLTKAAADAFAQAAAANGHEFEWANLVAEGFDPVMQEPDEPDWNNPEKVYSNAVIREMERIERNQATVIVFPVWWWSMPAILKGWIDRVWNNGWAYGKRSYPHNRVWMIAIAGNLAPSYQKRGYDTAMQVQLETGILGYCGIEDRRLEVLHGSIEGEPHPRRRRPSWRIILTTPTCGSRQMQLGSNHKPRPCRIGDGCPLWVTSRHQPDVRGLSALPAIADMSR